MHPKACISTLVKMLLYKHFSNAVLLKQVVTSSGSSTFYPVKLYSYWCDLYSSKLLLQPHLHQLCKKTRFVDNSTCLKMRDSKDSYKPQIILNVDWF